MPVAICTDVVMAFFGERLPRPIILCIFIVIVIRCLCSCIDDYIGVSALHTDHSDGDIHYFHLAFVIDHILFFCIATHSLVCVIIEQRLMPEC